MTGTPCAPAHLTTRGSPARVRLSHVEHIAEQLSPRDTQIMDTVHRLRLATGAHLERLHFADLSPASRGRTRRRVLNRLVSWRLLATLPRRIGGVRAGSTGLTYHLDTAGSRIRASPPSYTGDAIEVTNMTQALTLPIEA
jgi:hypothetical protein